MAAPPSSHSSGLQPKGSPHVRQRARSAKKLSNGISSYQESQRPQLSQCDRPPSDARHPRDATTPAKEPSAPPRRAATTTVIAIDAALSACTPGRGCDSQSPGIDGRSRGRPARSSGNCAASRCGRSWRPRTQTDASGGWRRWRARWRLGGRKRFQRSCSSSRLARARHVMRTSSPRAARVRGRRVATARRSVWPRTICSKKAISVADTETTHVVATIFTRLTSPLSNDRGDVRFPCEQVSHATS